jgi:hypothetical protein
MMDNKKTNKLSYAEARGIRNRKLTDLIANKIARGGGIGSSIKSGISQKIKANVVGLKEKFDPLNIARNLTGNLGAAILGNLTGRSREDMKYFTGKSRAKYLNDKDKTPKLKVDDEESSAQKELKTIDKAMHTKVGEGQKPKVKKNDSVANVLAKLYNLTKKYHEDDLKRMVKEARDKKIKEDGEEDWHNELIAALKGEKKSRKNKNKTATPTDTSPNLLDMVDKIKNLIEGEVERLLEKFGVNKLFKLLGRSALVPAAEAAAGAAGAEAAAGAAAGAGAAETATAVETTGAVATAGIGATTLVYGALLSPWVASAEERRKIEKNPNSPKYKDNPYAMKVRGEVKTENEGAIKNQKKGLKQYKRQEISEAVADKKNDDTFLKDVYGNNRVELTKWLKEHPAPFAMYQAPSDVKPNELQKVGSETSTAGAGQGSAKAAAMDPRRLDLVKPDAGVTTAGGASVGGMHGVKPVPQATPVPPEPNPISKKAVSSIQENNNLKIEQKVKPKTTVIDNSKHVNASGGSRSETIITTSVPVRNDESTWLKLQKTNYRFV